MEYELKAFENRRYRFKRISPIALLSLQTTIDLNDFEKTEKLFSFILENTEIEVSGTYVNVKEKDRDVYLPVGIESNLDALMEISTTFLNEVIKPVFQKSRE